jgi:hypothetical protein
MLNGGSYLVRIVHASAMERARAMLRAVGVDPSHPPDWIRYGYAPAPLTK